MMTTLAFQLLARGPAFLEQLRGSFEGDGALTERLSRVERPVEERQTTPPRSNPRRHEVDGGVSEDRIHRQLFTGAGDPPETDHLASHFDPVYDPEAETLPDVPPAPTRIDEEGDLFLVPEVPPSASALTTDRKERPAGKSKTRTGVKTSSSQVPTAKRKNANRKNDPRSDAWMPLTDTSGDESQRSDAESGKTAARPRRSGGAQAGRARETSTSRDRSKARVAAAKPESSLTSLPAPTAFDVHEGDGGDSALWSSDDEAWKRKTTKIGKAAGGTKPRARVKKKSGSASMTDVDPVSVPHEG